MVRVKMCGMTNTEDLGKAVYYGASAVGFIFYKKSPRYISPSKVRKLVEGLPPGITPVGVFVNARERQVKDICKLTRINTVQFHGDEDVAYCKRFTDKKVIKAFRVNEFFAFKSVMKYRVDAYLFDTYHDEAYGGTGKTFDWEVLKQFKFNKPVILSGGLTPSNVAQAIETVQPFMVDVCSGIEKEPGIKNPRLIREFFAQVK